MLHRLLRLGTDPSARINAHIWPDTTTIRCTDKKKPLMIERLSG